MELSKNSAHYKFYKLWWKKTPPNNLCDYFWGLVFALITLPFFLGALAYKYFAQHQEYDPIILKGFYYILNTVVMAIAGVVLGMGISFGVAYWKTSLLIIGIIVGLIVFLALLFWFSESEASTITSEFIKSKKEKVCPFIDWK